jgi:ribosomal protein L11 methyltransferase
MKQLPLWRISINTAPEAEDAVAETFGRVFNTPASTYTDVRTGRTTVSMFIQAGSVTLKTQRALLLKALSELANFGLFLGPARVRTGKIRRENWAESWKRHFKPLEVGHTLLVKPSWSKRRAKRGQSVVILNPGLSFGTGQHATTWFCLWELTRLRQTGQRQSLLDIGTGSGILAIAAAKLGYQPVEAFDFDPESVRVARANARRNRVSKKLHIFQQDLTRLPLRTKNKFDVICANLISTLLIAEHQRIISRLKPGGVLLLAGILSREFGEVRRVFESDGLAFVTSRRQREWTSGSFRLRPGKN